MTRLVHRPIQVTVQNRIPQHFTDGDHTYKVTDIIDSWSESGAWWQHEPQHTVYRIQTADESLFDIEQVGKDWFIYRIWD